MYHGINTVAQKPRLWIPNLIPLQQQDLYSKVNTCSNIWWTQRQGMYTLNPRPTSSVYSFNIVPLLPPTPAARVPWGRAFAAAFFASAARRLLVSSLWKKWPHHNDPTNWQYQRSQTIECEITWWIRYSEAKTYRMRVFAPPGGGGELGRAGDVAGEDY